MSNGEGLGVLVMGVVAQGCQVAWGRAGLLGTGVTAAYSGSICMSIAYVVVWLL